MFIPFTPYNVELYLISLGTEITCFFPCAKIHLLKCSLWFCICHVQLFKHLQSFQTWTFILNTFRNIFLYIRGVSIFYLYTL